MKKSFNKNQTSQYINRLVRTARMDMLCRRTTISYELVNHILELPRGTREEMMAWYLIELAREESNNSFIKSA